MARIAFIGLGRMGSGMARRLLAAGHELVVANRTAAAAEPLVAAGARFAASPRQAAQGADAVFVMVSDDEASRAVWLGPDGVLAGEPGQALRLIGEGDAGHPHRHAVSVGVDVGADADAHHHGGGLTGGTDGGARGTDGYGGADGTDGHGGADRTEGSGLPGGTDRDALAGGADGGGLAGAPAASAFAIECSTLSAGWVAELADRAHTRGWRYLDCPVTGLPDAAAAGELTLLIGSADDDLALARPLLQPLASQLIHFGPVGAGTAYKLIVNLIGAVQIAGIAEGLALAERAGLDLRQVEAALATGQAASPQVVRNARRVVAGDHPDLVTFSGKLRRKDAAYAMRLAQQLRAAAPFGATALSTLDELVAAGLGDVNESAVIEIARRRAQPSS